MAKTKEDRYPNCGEFLAAAEAAVHDRPMAVSVGDNLGSPTALEDAEAADPLHTVVASSAASPAETTVEPSQVGPTPQPSSAPAGPPPTAVPEVASTATAVEGPATSGAARRSRLSGRMLVVVLLVVAVVALAAVLAVVLATRGGGSHSGNGQGTTSSFRGPLSSAAEVPKSLATSFSGTADVKITGAKVCWSFTLHGVDKPTAAHIHEGGPTVSGPIVIPLGGAFKPSGCFESTQAATAAILKNPAGYYVNVHSLQYPDGAVRGQLTSTNVTPTGSTERVVGLKGIVTKGILDNCTVQARPVPGAVQTAVCARPSGSTGQLYYPQHLQLSTFSSTADLLRAYAAQQKAANMKSNFGRCDGTDWLGEGKWFHAPEAPGHPGKPGGHRFCYFAGNTAIIVWTHDRFAQPNHVDLLGIAKEGSSDHTDLFNWWQFWTHRIGKCLLLGCTASPR